MEPPRLRRHKTLKKIQRDKKRARKKSFEKRTVLRALYSAATEAAYSSTPVTLSLPNLRRSEAISTITISGGLTAPVACSTPVPTPPLGAFHAPKPRYVAEGYFTSAQGPSQAPLSPDHTGASTTTQDPDSTTDYYFEPVAPLSTDEESPAPSLRSPSPLPPLPRGSEDILLREDLNLSDDAILLHTDCSLEEPEAVLPVAPVEGTPPPSRTGSRSQPLQENPPVFIPRRGLAAPHLTGYERKQTRPARPYGKPRDENTRMIHGPPRPVPAPRPLLDFNQAKYRRLVQRFRSRR